MQHLHRSGLSLCKVTLKWKIRATVVCFLVNWPPLAQVDAASRLESQSGLGPAPRPLIYPGIDLEAEYGRYTFGY